ncbi:MAG: DegT/DnrJ/EryC1/StrS family aminotransferase [Proteobacteria bacterium]|nr:DegT/DnrJ/EryC1/StrS family aminotransferase [Pseudomonadota bacterium]
MNRELRLIDPDLGREETEAVSALLSDREALPYVAFVPRPNGPIQRLAEAFAAFLREGIGPDHPLVASFLRERGVSEVPLFLGGFASATGAIFAGLRSIGVAGGEVITTSLNYVGVPNAVIMAQAAPRFVDVDGRTFCMDPALIEAAVTPRTKAVIITHLNRFVDIAPVAELFRRKGYEFPLVQDASLAVGSTLRGLRPGVVNVGPGGFTVFSLATSKVITGLGGAILSTNDGWLLSRALTIAYQGMSFREIGVLDAFGANIKMNDINAAIALARLGKREKIFARRRELKALYDASLAPLAESGKAVLQDAGEEAVVTHYAVACDDRGELARRLYARHSIHLGMWHVHHMQEIYEAVRTSLPESERLDGRFTLLPFHTGLSDDEVRLICRALIEELGA